MNGLRHRVGLVLLALAVGGCSTNPADEITSLQAVVTDGKVVYAVADRTPTGSRLIRFDAEGNVVWERAIGAVSGDTALFHDGHLWVVEDEPAGTEPPSTISPDRLLKVDVSTGEISGSVEVGDTTKTPDLVIDGRLWLLSRFDVRFDVVDLAAVEVAESIDLSSGLGQTDRLSDPYGLPVGGVVDAVRLRDHLFLYGAEPESIIKYSIGRREAVAILELEFDGVNGVELHDDTIWLSDVPPGAVDQRDLEAHPLDPERFELGDPVPYYESPMGSLVTEDDVFDETDLNEITQIDRSTGEVVRIIEGRSPKFVLDGHLWMAGLERARIDG